MGGGLEFGVLGPVRVTCGDVEFRVPRGRQRLLLARLVVDAGQVVSSQRLLADVWDRSSHAARTGPVRTAVWELRRLLRRAAAACDAPVTDDVLVAQDGGYALAVDRGQVDSLRFEDGLTAGRSRVTADPPTALAHLDEALALRRGPAFGELAGDHALQIEAERLDQLVLDAQELRAQLLLDLGRHDQAVPGLGVLVQAYPARERLWAMLMTAQYRSGRQREALACYQEARRRLVTEAGVEPGPELRRLEQAILRHDAALEWRPGSAPPYDERRAGGGADVRAGDGTGNFRWPRTSLVGRKSDVSSVAAVLDRSRLVTLVGPGGCGKTRLALAVAEDARPRFPGGVWFVDLASVTDPDLVPMVVADVLRDEVSGEPTAPKRARDLDGRLAQPTGPVLLVLDNCEHVIDAVAELVSRKLLQRPDVHALATSREALRLDTEVVWRMAGLSLPSPGRGGRFLGSEAVELFVRRASAAMEGFAPSDETLEHIGRICRKVDGLPLAVELAAALVAMVPVHGIARTLDERFWLTVQGSRDRPPRQRSLRATLAWSVDLLDEPSRAVFARLGAFAGSFSFVAAREVLGPTVSSAAFAQGLERLVRVSLIECETGPDGVERYRMLATVRQDACERLEVLEDSDEVHRRHARYYADLAVAADHRVRGQVEGVDLSEGTRLIEVDLPNFRVALRWAMSHDDLDVALRLLGALRWFLSRLTPLDQLATWLGLHSEQEGDVPSAHWPRLLAASSAVALLCGRFEQFRHVSASAVTVARQHDAPQQLTAALVARAAAAIMAGELDEADVLLAEARHLCERLPDRWGLAWTLVGQSSLSYETGHHVDAWRDMEAALAILRDLGDRHSQVVPLALLALYALAAEEHEVARDMAAQAVDVVVRLEHEQAAYLAFGVLGLVELAAGHNEVAQDLFVRSLRSTRDDTTPNLILPADLEGLAMVAAATRGLYDIAATLLGAAARLRRSPGGTPATKWMTAVDSVTDLARARLGAARFEDQFDRGTRFGLAELLDLVEGMPRRTPPEAAF